jgi:hypothetical protein
MSDPKDLTDQELGNAWIEALDQHKGLGRKHLAALAEAKANAKLSSLDRPVSARDHYFALCLRLAWERDCAYRQKNRDEGAPPNQLKVMDNDKLLIEAELLMRQLIRSKILIEPSPPLQDLETQWEEAAKRVWLLEVERERRKKGQP